MQNTSQPAQVIDNQELAQTPKQFSPDTGNDGETDEIKKADYNESSLQSSGYNSNKIEDIHNHQEQSKQSNSNRLNISKNISNNDNSMISHGIGVNQSTTSSVAPTMRREQIDTQVNELAQIQKGLQSVTPSLNRRLKDQFLTFVNESFDLIFQENPKLFELSNKTQDSVIKVNKLTNQIQNVPQLPSFSYCASVLKQKQSYQKELNDFEGYSSNINWRFNAKEFYTFLSRNLVVPSQYPSQPDSESNQTPLLAQSNTQSRLANNSNDARSLQDSHKNHNHQSQYSPDNMKQSQGQFQQSYISMGSGSSQAHSQININQNSPQRSKAFPILGRPGWKPSKQSNNIFIFHLRSKQRQRIQSNRSFLPCSASTQIQGFLIITGGWGQGRSKTQTHVFNLKQKKFQCQSSHMSQPRHCHAIAAVSLQSIVVLGGCHDSPSNALNTCQNLSLHTNSWAMSLPPMCEKRFSSAATSFNGKQIYVFCGAKGKAASDRLSSIQRLRMDIGVSDYAWQFLNIKLPGEWSRRCLIGASQITSNQIMIYGDQNEDKNNFILNLGNEKMNNQANMMVLKTARVPIINGFSEPAMFVQNTLFTMEFDSNYLYWFSMNDHQWHYKGYPKIK